MKLDQTFYINFIFIVLSYNAFQLAWNVFEIPGRAFSIWHVFRGGRTMRSNIRVAGCVLLAIQVLCGMAANAATNPKPALGKADVVVGISTDIVTLDMFKSSDSFSNNIMFNVYDTLVRLVDGVFVPGFAKSWSVDSTGTVWTLKLTSKAKSASGRDLNAQDVKFTLERARKSTGSVKRAVIITGIEVVDTDTIRLTLDKAYGGMLGLLSIIPIVEEEGYLASGDKVAFNNSETCTGPYQLVEWIKGERIVLKANRNFYGTKPSIQNVIYRIILEKSAGVIALETGEVDAYFSMNPADKSIVKANPGLVLEQGPSTGVYFMALNQKDERLQNKKLRQAIYLAINKEDIVRGAFDGAASIAQSPVPVSFTAYPKDFVATPHNAERARQLLAEAGYPNGITLTLSIIDDEMYTKPAVIMQDQLRKVGITMKIDTYERGTWNTEIFGKKVYQLTMMRYTPPIFDSDTALFDAFHSSGTFFFNQQNTPDLNALLEKGRYENTISRRIEIYRSILKYIDENALEVPLVYEVSFIPHKKGLEGVEYSPNEIYRIFNWKWAN